jgi:hypothetical protein
LIKSVDETDNSKSASNYGNSTSNYKTRSSNSFKIESTENLKSNYSS